MKVLQINQDFVEAKTDINIGTAKVMVTPPLDGDYWLFRVPVSDKQAIIGFPKFMTIGIGFQIEEKNWNTDLPFQCDAEMIFNHISLNKGDDNISDDDCIEAIKVIQVAAAQLVAAKSN